MTLKIAMLVKPLPAFIKRQMSSLKKASFSKVICWVIVALWITGLLGYGKWQKKEVIQYDVKGYYCYLPALFVHGDLSFNFTDDLQGKKRGRYYVTETKGSGKVVKMSLGLALLYTPAFLLAHGLAPLLNYQADGFSEIYHLAISFGHLFYTIPALVLLRRMLRERFSDFITGVTLFGVFIGTNCFYYATLEAGMSHIYSCSLLVFMLYYNFKWYTKEANYYLVPLGLIAGLASLIRPVNILFLLIPLLYGIPEISLKEKVRRIFSEPKYFILACLGFLMAWLPQLLFWKLNTGSWLYYTYGDEGFYWLDPKIIQGLFGFRKGWFIYTPMMFLAFIGIPFLQRWFRKATLSTMVFLACFIYVTFSWWCWWYGGSFGARTMIDIYGLMTFPLAALFQSLSRLRPKVITNTAIVLIVIGLSYTNYFQIKQYNSTLLHWDAMTYDAYKAVFFQQKFPPNYDSLIDKPDYEKAKNRDDH